MINLLKNYVGKLNVNGIDYIDVKTALNAFKDYNGQLIVKLDKTSHKQSEPSESGVKVASPINEVSTYRITVKQYMTKPATKEFDFHDKWNNGIPMPYRMMTGTILSETKGMVQMELHGERVEGQTNCMKCGKALTNQISKYFGIGPECGGHNYTNPFNSQAELDEAIRIMDKQISEVKWTGWIIKSAITEREEV